MSIPFPLPDEAILARRDEICAGLAPLLPPEGLITAEDERRAHRHEGDGVDAIVALLADRKRNIHITGGRITGHVAAYLHTHLQMARPGVSLLPATQSFWPQYLLDVGRNDVLLFFDIRRYDARMLDFAASAQQRGAKVVLITDQWISPIARLAVHSLPLRIEAPSSWDSNIVPLFLAEALVAATVNASWRETEARIEGLEEEKDHLKDMVDSQDLVLDSWRRRA